jgi:hypothetical protein
VRELADELGFDVAGTHRALRRLSDAELYSSERRRVFGAPAEELSIEDRLRAEGLRNDSSSQVICRWIAGTGEDELLIDAMPSDASILGFENRWQRPALARAPTARLASTTSKLSARRASDERRLRRRHGTRRARARHGCRAQREGSMPSRRSHRAQRPGAELVGAPRLIP